MILYIEGISCAGKTSFIDRAKERFKSAVSISELPDDYKKHSNLDDFCRYNDERKCRVARKLEKENGIVLVDRGYASTLAYSYIQFKQNTSLEYLKSIRWYCNGISNNKLLRPDMYVFIEVDGETAIERAKRLNRFNTNIAWYTNPEIGNEFYHSFFRILEPEVPLLVIDGKTPQSKKVSQLKEFISELKRNG
jgi:thymidylate kinase